MPDTPPETAFRKFARGFRATANPVQPPLVNPNDGGTGTQDDLLDYASLDMIEREAEWDLGKRGDTEAEPVRTINNALDFLGEVGDEIVSVLDHGVDKLPAKTETDWALRTYVVPAQSWKATRYTVEGTQAKQIARKSNDRATMTLVNLSTEVLWICDESSTQSSSFPTNMRAVPISKVDGTGAYSPIAHNTQEEVWCRSTTGAACIIEVTEFFGQPQQINY